MFVLSKLSLCCGRFGGYKAAVPFLIRALSQTPSSESTPTIVSFLHSVFCDNQSSETLEGDLSLSSLQQQLVEKQIITESDREQVWMCME